MTSERTDGLNAGQWQAARTLNGRLLIDAGAGTGKTRTLTQRVVYALTPNAVPDWIPAEVDQLLAVTFTDKAAGEIAERVRRALRDAGRIEESRRLDSAWFSTIHGLCSRLLRRHALEAGLDPAFHVVEAVDAYRMQEEAFAEAADAALQRPGAASELFATYSYAGIFSAVTGLERALRVRDLTIEDVELEPVRDAEELRREAIELFGRMGQGWDACGSRTDTAEKQRDACPLTVSRLEAIPIGSLPPAALAEEVWEVLQTHPNPPKKLKHAEELLAEMNRALARLLGEAAAAATAPAAAALRELVRSYGDRYREAKAAAGGLDFEDLQLEAVRLLERRPDVAQRYRDRFRLVMVDEFQDTDGLQLRLVRALTDEALCTVGDERQSIYRFRGGDVAVYREHVARMRREGALSVALTENYRSHEQILAFVNAVFGTDALFGAGVLGLEHARDEKDSGAAYGDERVEITMVHRERNKSSVRREAQIVAERFAALREAGVPAGSMAVLLRSYTHAETFAAALRARGLQALVVGGSRFFGLPEVAALRALSRVVANAADDEALATYLASPLAAVSDDGLWRLRNDVTSGRRSGSLIDALREPGAAGSRDEQAAQTALGALERARGRVGRMPLSEILLRAVEESGADLRMMAAGEEGRQAYANVLKFARLADAFEASGGVGPAAFVEYLDAKEESRDHEAPAALTDEGVDSVRIMSVHASKGLEFPVVALPLLGDPGKSDKGFARWRPDGRTIRLAVAVPSDRSGRAGTNLTPWFAEFDELEASEEREESQRLFYVACTRAEDKLLLVGGANLDNASTADVPLTWLRAALDELHERGAVPACAIERVDPVEEDGAEALSATEAEEETSPAGFPPAPPPAATPVAAVAPDRLSYSDVALYRRCGLRFHAQKVLRIGGLSDRSAARAFGSAFHAAAQLLVDGFAVDAARLCALSAAHELPAEAAGRLAVAVDAFASSAVLGELSRHETVSAETPFVVPVGDAFLLRGSIDAYGRTGSEALVLDYKTGTGGTASALRDAFALQASCYALVALRHGHERVRVVFLRPELDADDDTHRIEFAFAAGTAAEIEEQLLADHRKMAAGEYEALASWDESVCGDCPAADSICDLERKRR